jgi:hypothetical protein
VKKLITCLSIAFLFATTSYAQDFNFEAQAGAGYTNPDSSPASGENLVGSFYVSGVSFDRFTGGSVFEVQFVAGDFKTRTWARGEGTVLGPTYAALDVALNGDWDPRAVFGINFKDWTFEGYSQIDGDTAYGFAARWRLF